MNRLGHEKSPYLQQHKDNPVHWQPWGEEAFARARREDKPIFLSVGYSTCHWCHVMAHESFESEAIAALLNKDFICVKVDREERPDVDNVYMMATQVATGSGGWPMSVFMDADGLPFFCGTYFPPEDRHGRPGFPRVLGGIVDAWIRRRPALVQQGQQHLNAVIMAGRGQASDDLPHSAIDRCVDETKAVFDAEYGGFGSAPKFPRPATFQLLLRAAARRADADALHMVSHTLLRMYQGGIYDHLGGGFARYSTDREWLVPHFEKMLYDNAQLVTTLIQLHQHTGEQWPAEVARDTLDYILREMRHEDGAFYSAEDADSEGREGAFYVWTPEQLDEVLGDDAPVAAMRYGVTHLGNFEDTGESVLHLAADVAAPPLKLAEIRQRLFAARAQRPRPSLDDKVLTAWNGMMIGAMALAGRALSEPRYTAAAQKAAEFICERLILRTGLLLRRWRLGESRFAAFLEDYAMLSEGLLSLYQSTFDVRWLDLATTLTEQAVERFWDKKAGGFFFTERGGDKNLKAAVKDAYDGATPSGNSVMAHVLLQLYAITSDEGYRDRAEATLKAFGGQVASAPRAYPNLLSALDDLRAGPITIAIAGDAPALRAAAAQRYDPGGVIVPAKALQSTVDGQPAAYICHHFVCEAPVLTPNELLTRP